MVKARAGKPECPEPHYLVRAFFFQEPEYFIKNWNGARAGVGAGIHSVVPSCSTAVFKNFVKIMTFDIILQAKKLFLVLQ